MLGHILVWNWGGARTLWHRVQYSCQSVLGTPTRGISSSGLELRRGAIDHIPPEIPYEWKSKTGFGRQLWEDIRIFFQASLDCRETKGRDAEKEVGFYFNARWTQWHNSTRDFIQVKAAGAEPLRSSGHSLCFTVVCGGGVVAVTIPTNSTVLGFYPVKRPLKLPQRPWHGRSLWAVCTAVPDCATEP